MSAPDLLNTTLQFVIDDISTAGQIFVPVPTGFDGTVIEVRLALNGAITGADADITLKIAGVAMTNGVITVPISGSGAGVVTTGRPTSLNSVAAGVAIEVETDGASTGTVQCFGTLVIRR